jgi:hypothetical protein
VMVHGSRSRKLHRERGKFTTDAGGAQIAIRTSRSSPPVPARVHWRTRMYGWWRRCAAPRLGHPETAPTDPSQVPLLLDQGAPLALPGLVENMQGLAGPSPTISSRSSGTGRMRVSDEHSTALYRIARESLSSALRHAHAQHDGGHRRRQGRAHRLGSPLRPPALAVIGCRHLARHAFS